MKFEYEVKLTAQFHKNLQQIAHEIKVVYENTAVQKSRYLLTLQVSRYCLLTLQSSYCAYTMMTQRDGHTICRPSDADVMSYVVSSFIEQLFS